MLLKSIGPDGQRRLGAARALLVGCGALGSVIADQLARAGIGFLRIVDRDIVEATNLQRQVLFEEEDVRQGIPKAIAAANRLRRVNSSIVIEPVVSDLHGGNIEDLAKVDLILDGTDNVETRYLINDLAVKRGIPWIYGACVGTEGRVMLVRAGGKPCLRCIFKDAPRPGELPTCDTAGVLGPAAGVTGAVQAGLALQVLSGHVETAPAQMLVFDLWAGRFHTMPLYGGEWGGCPCCGERRFEFLEALQPQNAVSLCGRNAVQVGAPAGNFDLSLVAGRLESVGQVQRTPWLIRCQLHDVGGISLTVFSDGRMIIHGTNDLGRARAIAARFVGT